jgi:uncharacterized membrane protein YoaK (UPF0700 family)
VAAAAAVHGGPWNLAQALAIPVFMAAVAAAWLIAHASSLHGAALTRLLLVIQFLLLLAVLAFSVTTAPSANPHGLMAGIAVMIAVCAMAFQYALLRLALPNAVSTAVMTGNLTNTVLSLMELLSPQQPLMPVDLGRLKRSLRLLIGFLMGLRGEDIAEGKEPGEVNHPGDDAQERRQSLFQSQQLGCVIRWMG